MNKRSVAVIMVLLAVLILTGCGTNDVSNDSNAGNGSPAAVKDVLVVAQGADAYTMDPAKHTTFPTATVLFHIYDPLVTLDEKGNIRPCLAESWTTIDDNTWQFKLRQGVYFSNGEEFDAEAVKFTIDRVLDPKTNAPNRSRLAAIERVEIVDKYTVNIITSEPYPTLLHSLTENSFNSLIVPPKYMQENDEDILATKPVGTGPYELVEWVKDDHITLKAKTDYWGGTPAIKEIIFKPIPEVSTRVSELKSGGIDVAPAIDPELIPTLEEAEGTKVAVVPSDRLFFVVLNTLEGGPLADKRVRQALNYAVDVDAIIQSIMSGYGERLAVTLPKDAFGYDPSLTPYPYDPEKAKELLAEAGYPDGFTVPFISRQGRYLKDKEIVEAVAGYLEQVGVKTEIQFVEPGVWAQISEKHERKGLSFPGWSGLDAELVWYPLLYSGQYQSYYSNPELDKLLDEGRSTVDEAKRKEAYSKAGRLIKEEAVHIPLFQVPHIHGLHSKLDWQPRMDEIMDFRKASFRQ